MDAIERDISDLDRATRVLGRHMPESFERLRRWQGQTVKLFGQELTALVGQAADVFTICLARIVLRHGSAADVHRYFHDEQHPFDLMRRLGRLYAWAPASLSDIDYITLAIFTAGHDLRQDLDGRDTDGVGRNERASADELERILAHCGIGPERYPEMIKVLRQMIYGTTFYTRGFTYRGDSFRGGVLAPALVGHFRRPGAGDSNITLTPDQINLVLLATDIDTGNVADPFVLFVNRGVRLCREFFAVSGRPELDTTTAGEVYHFLTAEQERYFFDLQQFHAPESISCFQADKEANGLKLRELTATMRSEFDTVLERPGHGVTGEQVIDRYLNRAGECV